MSEFKSDTTIVGGGIAGLWIAKELLERGYSVDVVEKDAKLAAGATTRNEGWLHAGTYHAVAIDDEKDAELVTNRTKYGHEEIIKFAPESIEQDTSYAFINTEELAQAALGRWDKFGVQSREVTIEQFNREGFDTSRIRAGFKVEDKSVNSRIICNKLARFILENGGRIFTGAEFVPDDGMEAEMIIEGEHHRLRSDAFIIAAGAGTKQIFEQIAGDQFPMRYFKSHLLVTPRATESNYFYMDPLEAGIMSHGAASIVGINREAVSVNTSNYDVIPATRELIYNALGTMLPRARQFNPYGIEVQGVACIKVDVVESVAETSVVSQDLNIKVFEPIDGYICAIPGKMTEAPALARATADYIESRGTQKKDARPTTTIAVSEYDIPSIKERPADEWMLTRKSDEDSF